MPSDSLRSNNYPQQQPQDHTTTELDKSVILSRFLYDRTTTPDVQRIVPSFILADAGEDFNISRFREVVKEFIVTLGVAASRVCSGFTSH
jgi:hypothetical protein